MVSTHAVNVCVCVWVGGWVGEWGACVCVIAD